MTLASSPPSHMVVPSPLWSTQKQQRLQGMLSGMWAQDQWHFSGPRAADGGSRAFGVYFACMSPSLNGELKYAMWRKFTNGTWKTHAVRRKTASHLSTIVRWLNTLAPLPPSLLARNLEEWELLLRTYLVERNRYHVSCRRSLLASQTYKTFYEEDAGIRFFRMVYVELANAYDDREIFDKDMWDMRALGMRVNLSKSDRVLNFSQISPLWLRELAKRFMRHNMAVHSPSDCLNKLEALRSFSRFVEASASIQGAEDITRASVLAYMHWLQAQGKSNDNRRRLLLGLHGVLTVCAYALDVPGLTKEEVIFDSDLPKRPEGDTRELPEEVLDQMRTHLEALPTTILRMVVILLECGLRVSELCTLSLDCLTCDDKHEWYLRLFQLKFQRPHMIPLVNVEVVAAIQAQQHDVREIYGPNHPYLFPSPRFPERPYQQTTFNLKLNAWAVEHQIRKPSGHIWRLQAHQFRHHVGMRLLNAGVSIHVISRLFGHQSTAMTERYARARDQTVRDALARAAQARRTVDYRGQVVTGDVGGNDAEAQLLRTGIRGQTLPVGGCGRLVVLGPCDHANKCVTCPFWLTSTEDLPALHTFLDRSRQLERRAQDVGNRVVVTNQQHIIPNPQLRIARLEALAAGESTGKGEGEGGGEGEGEGESGCERTEVPALLAQWRLQATELEAAYDEVSEAHLLFAAKQLARSIADVKQRIAGLEQALTATDKLSAESGR